MTMQVEPWIDMRAISEKSWSHISNQKQKFLSVSMLKKLSIILQWQKNSSDVANILSLLLKRLKHQQG